MDIDGLMDDGTCVSARVDAEVMVMGGWAAGRGGDRRRWGDRRSWGGGVELYDG